jgi:hypothetical protein
MNTYHILVIALCQALFLSPARSNPGRLELDLNMSNTKPCFEERAVHFGRYVETNHQTKLGQENTYKVPAPLCNFAVSPAPETAIVATEAITWLRFKTIDGLDSIRAIGLGFKVKTENGTAQIKLRRGGAFFLYRVEGNFF